MSNSGLGKDGGGTAAQQPPGSAWRRFVLPGLGIALGLVVLVLAALLLSTPLYRTVPKPPGGTIELPSTAASAPAAAASGVAGERGGGGGDSSGGRITISGHGSAKPGELHPRNQELNRQRAELEALARAMRQQQERSGALPPTDILANLPPPGAGLDPVVYNVGLAPQGERRADAPERTVLLAGQRTTLRFDIGPRWRESVLAADAAEPSPELLAGPEAAVPLNVVLACDFCEADAQVYARTVYRRQARRADEVHFSFTPRLRGNQPVADELLQLSITNGDTGREYGRLVIEVRVADAATTAAAAASTAASTPAPGRGPGMVAGRPHGLPGDDATPAADVTLYATLTDQQLTLRFEPHGAALRQGLAAALDPSGAPRALRTGIESTDTLKALAESDFGLMSALLKQDPAMLALLRADGLKASLSEGARTALVLKDDDLDKVNRTLGDLGQTLYANLFVESPDNADLERVLTALHALADARNKAGERPLRLAIVTNNVALPWQYLHPSGEAVQAHKFWGLRFSLSVRRVLNNVRGTDPPRTGPGAGKVLFARYQAEDPTQPLADEQIKLLRTLPVAPGDLLQVRGGGELETRMREQRNDVAALVTFLHAQAGTAGEAPHLIFNNGDFVSSLRLERLLNDIPRDAVTQRYLRRGPIVLLNACETGPSLMVPHISLASIFLKLGARGAIVTEVSVWQDLGHYMALQLIPRLARGEPAADALTAVRRQLLAERSNPLGLLYVFYGEADSGLKFVD